MKAKNNPFKKSLDRKTLRTKDVIRATQRFLLKNNTSVVTLALFSFLLVTVILFSIPNVSAAISIDLNVTSATVTIYGDDAGDYSGMSVSSGDINGDGIADVIIGAYYANPDGRSNAGETYVIYGNASMPGTIDLNAVSANITIYGDDADDYSGMSVSSGDINGDGIADVIIGAYFADPAGGSNAGETYVIYGNASMPSTIDLNAVSANITIYGDDADDHSGCSVSSGDINNDGIDDVIIGADVADPAGGTNAGETYVIYGNASMPGTIDLNATSANITIYGDDANDCSGRSVSSGDINNDGIDDVIIGVRYADPAGGSSAGETYVIYGNASMPGTIDLNAVSANVTIYGDDVNDYSGHSVSSGDINGDGIADVIIGAYGADPAGGSSAGETYVIYGNASMPSTIDLNAASANITIYGDDVDDYSGSSVSSGDINGDGIADVIIGAKGSSFQTYAGETYVIYGNASMPSTIDLNAASANVTIYGDDANDYSGSSVSSGDINGDGIADVIIGANAADPAGGSNAGETYVICDVVPPGDVTGFTATAGDGQVSLSWTNPDDADFVGTKVIRKEGSYPTNVTDGTEVCNCTASPGSTDSYTDTGLTNGITYYYTAFAYDEVPLYSSAVDSAQDCATPSAAAPPPVPVPEYNAIGLLALVGILSVVLAVAASKKK